MLGRGGCGNGVEAVAGKPVRLKFWLVVCGKGMVDNKNMLLGEVLESF